MELKREVIIGLICAILALTVLYVSFQFPKQKQNFFVRAENGLSIGIYWFENGTNPVTHIEWGTVNVGTENVTVYVKNNGTTPFYVYTVQENWFPRNLYGRLNLYTIPKTQQVNASQIKNMTIVLSLAQIDVTDVNFTGYTIVYAFSEPINLPDKEVFSELWDFNMNLKLTMSGNPYIVSIKGIEPKSWITPDAIHSHCGHDPDDAWRAIDGSTGIGWYPNLVGNHWMIFDLGKSNNITKVRFWCASVYLFGDGIGVEVYVGDDTANLGEKVADAVLTNTGDWCEIDGFSKNGRYIKVVDKAHDWIYSIIYEFAYYGTVAPSPISITKIDWIPKAPWYSWGLVPSNQLSLTLNGNGSGNLKVNWKDMSDNTKVLFSNGTKLSATDFWNSTTDHIDLNITLNSELSMSIYPEELPRWYSWAWLIPSLIVAIELILKRVENPYAQLFTLVTIEDGFLRVSLILVAIPLWLCIPVSITLDTIVHSIAQRKFKKRFLLALLYNVIWYGFYFIGSLWYWVFGIFLGVLFHFVLDLIIVHYGERT